MRSFSRRRWKPFKQTPSILACIAHPSRAESIQVSVEVSAFLAPDDGLPGHPEVLPRPEQRSLARDGGLGGGGLQ